MLQWFDNIKYNFGIACDFLVETKEFDGQIFLAPYWGRFLLVMLLIAAAGYFIGSINFAVLLSKIKYKDDIRRHGSGNGGATNMLRTYGKGAAALTYLGDFLKAFIVTLLGIIIGGETFGCIGGLACMFGHAFPVYFNFKGGKGVACASGVILCLDPLVFLVCLLVFVVMVLGTKYVSLGSVMGAGLFPVFYCSMYQLHFSGYPGEELYPNAFMTIGSLIMAGRVVVLHRKNLKRIMDGTENKVSFKKKVEEDK